MGADLFEFADITVHLLRCGQARAIWQMRRTGKTWSVRKQNDSCAGRDGFFEEPVQVVE
jgi:hypothetical protein